LAERGKKKGGGKDLKGGEKVLRQIFFDPRGGKKRFLPVCGTARDTKEGEGEKERGGNRGKRKKGKEVDEIPTSSRRREKRGKEKLLGGKGIFFSYASWGKKKEKKEAFRPLPFES